MEEKRIIFEGSILENIEKRIAEEAEKDFFKNREKCAFKIAEIFGIKIETLHQKGFMGDIWNAFEKNREWVVERKKEIRRLEVYERIMKVHKEEI